MLDEYDVIWLRAIGDGSYPMRRGLTAAWVSGMIERGLVRRRRPCESNEWQTDFVLTPAGKIAARHAGGRRG